MAIIKKPSWTGRLVLFGLVLLLAPLAVRQAHQLVTDVYDFALAMLPGVAVVLALLGLVAALVYVRRFW